MCAEKPHSQSIQTKFTKIQRTLNASQLSVGFWQRLRWEGWCFVCRACAGVTFFRRRSARAAGVKEVLLQQQSTEYFTGGLKSHTEKAAWTAACLLCRVNEWIRILGEGIFFFLKLYVSKCLDRSGRAATGKCPREQVGGFHGNGGLIHLPSGHSWCEMWHNHSVQ